MPPQECLKMLRAVAANPKLNERARKELLLTYLPLIFPEEENRSRLDALAGGAEKFVTTAPSSLSSSTRGFIDTHNGALTLEFKRDLLDKAASAVAETELKRYIASLWTERGINASFCCIATDVLRWRIWRPVPNATPSDGRYTADMVSLEFAEEIDASTPDADVAENLFLVLKRVLIDENLLTLTAENLRRDFGPESAQYALFLPILRQIVAEARSSPDVKLATDLWEDYQAYNARRVSAFDIDFYASQLYLVMLSRLIVAACFQDKTTATLDDESIREVLTGDFFLNRLRLANFVDQDFFGWTTTEPWLERFLPLARQLFHSLRSYDFSTSSSGNVLRLIYDEMMPEEHRDNFGQRSTPNSLATEIVRQVLPKVDDELHFLDPACGTGSFLHATLEELRAGLEISKVASTELLPKLIAAVTGIDIDPVAVILAKAVWTLALIDLLEGAEQVIDIPIYHADSLFVASDQLMSISGRRASTSDPVIVFDDARIRVPVELFNDTIGYDRFVDWCYEKAKTIAEEREATGNALNPISMADIKSNLPSILGDAYSPELEERAEDLTQAAVILVNELAQRIINKRNGIWAFVLRNSYRPSLFAGRFNVIATNLPWLAMSSLPNVPYKEQLLTRAKYFGIQPKGAAFLHAEIATTFALHSVAHFLADGGHAAFVMPRTLFDGDQHDPFRTFKFIKRVPLTITEIWDLVEVEHLFKIPSCVIFCNKLPPADIPQTSIPAHIWSADQRTVRAAKIALTSYGKKSAWQEEEAESYKVTGHGYYDRCFREGADLMPRTALFVELIGSNTAQRAVSVQTSEEERANRNGKLLKGRQFKGVVNRQYLFKTVTSNLLLPFVVLREQLPTVLLPVEFAGDEPEILSSDELVNRGDSTTAQWFKKVDKELEGQNIRQRIDVRNKLTQQRPWEARYLVHYGAGGSLSCAGIQVMEPADRKRFIADQTTYVCGTDDEDEAYYLIGMLNAPYLSKAIKAFQAKGAFGPRHLHKLPVNAIPQYNPADSAHRRVAELARSVEKSALDKLTPKMRDTTVPIAARRTLLRKAIKDELTTLDQAAEEVLSR